MLYTHTGPSYNMYYNSFYGTSSAFSYMTSLGCSGSENRLIDCYYYPIAHTNCGQGQHAGVQCVGMFVQYCIASGKLYKLSFLYVMMHC